MIEDNISCDCIIIHHYISNQIKINILFLSHLYRINLNYIEQCCKFIIREYSTELSAIRTNERRRIVYTLACLPMNCNEVQKQSFG